MPTFRSRRAVIRPLRKPSHLHDTPDFRGDVAVAHASIIVFGAGILIAGMIWAIRKDESRRAGFQAAQAAVWQIIFVLTMLLLDRVMARVLAWALLGDLLAGGTVSTASLWCMRGVQLFVAAPFIGIGLYAALTTWHGRAFHYPLIGRWLEGQ